MHPAKVIYQLLSSDSKLKDLIGDKVFPQRIPQKTPFPAVVYFLVSNHPSETKQAASDLDTLTYQISVYATSYQNVIEIAEEVRRVLDRYRNDSENIDHIIFLRENDLFDEEAEVYHKALDFKIRHKR